MFRVFIFGSWVNGYFFFSYFLCFVNLVCKNKIVNMNNIKMLIPLSQLRAKYTQDKNRI